MAEQAATELEGIKLQYDTLLTEYKMVRDIIADSRQMQGQLDSITLAALGISIPIILAILERGASSVGTILLIPILFLAVAFTQLRHERMLSDSGIYVDAELRPQISRLVSKLAGHEVPVLGFEGFLSRRSWTTHLTLEWIATASRALLGLATGLGVVVLFLYIRLAFLNSAWEPYEVWLLVIDGLMLVVNLFVALRIARTRYAYLQKNYYKNVLAKAKS